MLFTQYNIWALLLNYHLNFIIIYKNKNKNKISFFITQIIGKMWNSNHILNQYFLTCFFNSNFFLVVMLNSFSEICFFVFPINSTFNVNETNIPLMYVIIHTQ